MLMFKLYSLYCKPSHEYSWSVVIKASCCCCCITLPVSLVISLYLSHRCRIGIGIISISVVEERERERCWLISFNIVAVINILKSNKFHHSWAAQRANCWELVVQGEQHTGIMQLPLCDEKCYIKNELIWINLLAIDSAENCGKILLNLLTMVIGW